MVHATGGGLLYLAGIRKVGAQVAATLGYLEPLFAAALGVGILGEKLTVPSALGGALILAAGYLVVRENGRRHGTVDAPGQPG